MKIFHFSALVHPENQLNAFLMYSGVDAWRVIELQSSQGSGGYGEFLLVFQTLSIYVDIQGRKSRDREIMYPAVPTHISKSIESAIENFHSIFTVCSLFSLLRWTSAGLLGYAFGHIQYANGRVGAIDRIEKVTTVEFQWKSLDDGYERFANRDLSGEFAYT